MVLAMMGRTSRWTAAASPFSSERDSLLLSNDEKDDRRKDAKVGSFGFDTDREKILPRSRPTVHFKIKIGVDNQSAAAAARFSSEGIRRHGFQWTRNSSPCSWCSRRSRR
ncbi:unnamed protein product [Musa acuminata subsp. burmannicoides]